jgi:signal transduction histidine kinase
MERDLISAKEKAVESDRLKSAFLANMSHEIRTPLNSILGFSDLLTSLDLDKKIKSEYADMINLSGNNLLSIINDILDISKIEAGQIILTEKKFSAFEMISDIQKEYTLKARSKNIELRLSFHESEKKTSLLGDESRIKQILINFVGNAMKFTDSGYIEIGMKIMDSKIQFHVKDTGIGISKEFHDKIFDRFRQVESAQTRKYGGNGLGLAITKNLAELLGGKIHLKSSLHEGSTFFLTLPNEYILKT